MVASENNEVQYEGEQIGVITHFFDKISVAVIEAKKTISLGDEIRVYDKQGNIVVEQKIDSMEVDGAKIESADVGDEFGMKVEGDVKEGYQVYR
jgi:hypothetical protein